VGKPRPAVKAKDKRKIRQRCAFGCVICGLPLYEYDHIDPWAKVQKHVADDITLLCDRHHKEKTIGLLPVAEVRRANSHPFNKVQGVSPPYSLPRAQWDQETACEFLIGNTLVKTPRLENGDRLIAIDIEGEEILGFTFEDGCLLLTLQAFDREGHRIAWIDKGELVYSIAPWDIRFEGRTLSIREAHGSFLLETEFLPPNRVEVRRGHFLHAGRELELTPGRAMIDGHNELRECELTGRVGLCIAESATRPGTIVLVPRLQLPANN
jgi:trigger factor